MAGEKTTVTGHMRACGRLLEIDPLDREKRAQAPGDRAVDHQSVGKCFTLRRIGYGSEYIARGHRARLDATAVLLTRVCAPVSMKSLAIRATSPS